MILLFAIYQDVRTSISISKQFLCNAIFRDRNSLLYRFATGRLFTSIVSAMVAIFLSALLLIFSFTVFWEFYVILYLVAFVYLWVSLRVKGKRSTTLTDDAGAIAQRLAVATPQVFLLVVSYVVLAVALPIPNVNFSQTEIFDFVDAVNHQCHTFHVVSRIFYFFDLASLTIGNLEGVSRGLAVSIQATTASIPPLMAYVFCLRFLGPREPV